MAMLDPASRDEASRIEDVVTRLTTQFAELPQSRVSTAVGEAHREFEGATVRDFVPILVEKRARDTLELEAHVAITVG